MIAMGQVWCIPVIPIFRGQKQEDLLEFWISLCCRVRVSKESRGDFYD